jgi:hypothetical protein
VLLCAHFDESIYLLARQSERQSKAERQNVALVARVTSAEAKFFLKKKEGLQIAGQGEGSVESRAVAKCCSGGACDACSSIFFCLKKMLLHASHARDACSSIFLFLF